jgi:hypothetical protein
MTIFSRSPSRLIAPATMCFSSCDSNTATGSSAPLSSRVSTRLRRSPRSEPTDNSSSSATTDTKEIWLKIWVQFLGGDAELLGHLGVGRAAVQPVLQRGVGLLDLARLDPRDRVDPELDATSRSYFSITSIKPKMP